MFNLFCPHHIWQNLPSPLWGPQSPPYCRLCPRFVRLLPQASDLRCCYRIPHPNWQWRWITLFDLFKAKSALARDKKHLKIESEHKLKKKMGRSYDFRWLRSQFVRSREVGWKSDGMWPCWILRENELDIRIPPHPPHSSPHIIMFLHDTQVLCIC